MTINSLSGNQQALLKEFYSQPHTKVVFTKSQRKAIWDDFKKNRAIPHLNLAEKCPALLSVLNRALTSGNLVQSAVFSECVYAQTLANMLGLDQFIDVAEANEGLPEGIAKLAFAHSLKPRYIYKSADGSRILLQAGGNGGIDSALFSLKDDSFFTIEFKEPGAKTSEPDLPAYGEDGELRVDHRFLSRNAHFEPMLREQLERGLNFWRVKGSNVNEFSVEAINIAVAENYSAQKFADAICVEDSEGFLVMMPADQVGIWAVTQGEIRPAGRNSYSVWTPVALRNFIAEAGGRIENETVIMPADKMATAARRGGDGEISRYKVNPLFFVRVENVKNVGGEIYFRLKDVEQLKPTITAKMFFTDLAIVKVQSHYLREL